MRPGVLVFIAVVAGAGISSAWAQPSPPPPQAPSQNANLLPPAPPPVPASPLDFFRKLVAMTTAERQTALTGKTERDRRVLEEKIREFEALTPEQREARFQALQRQLDFRILIKLPQSNRVDRLAQLSEPDRQWLSARLGQWDQLSADLQTAILTNLALLRIFYPENTGWQAAPPDYRYLSARQREAIDRAVEQWNKLPEDKQQIIREHFLKLFALDDKDKAKALQPLNPTEQAQMKRCLAMYNNLPADKKERCVTGFEKFAELSHEERDQFLRNAEEWQKMSPQDRQMWRNLVSKLGVPRPPMPPGMYNAPLPPAPPAPKIQTRFPPPLPLATNL